MDGLLKAHPAVGEAEQGRERQQRPASLRSALADTAARGRRLVRNMELLDVPDHGLAREISERHAELQAQAADLRQLLAAASVR
ncbi:hypothetical protein AB0I98_38395 [Streptomyces sp. NPDC050211]|uniref:hypothetical protein n=1 Tax=Streptomyces sp. NPDC050211 TaxID=3154932 RepID=UPI003438B3C1